MQRRILIIDDHDDLGTELEEVFSHVGHKVTVLKERAEALAIDNIRAFDLVITDLDVDSSLYEPGSKLNGAICPKEISPPRVGEPVVFEPQPAPGGLRASGVRRIAAGA